MEVVCCVQATAAIAIVYHNNGAMWAAVLTQIDSSSSRSNYSHATNYHSSIVNYEGL